MACSSSSKFFSFAEVVQGRDSAVRITDDLQLHAVELVMVMSGSSRDDAGKTLRRIPDEIFPSDKMSERNTGGSGNSKTKLVSFENAIELIMVLPGKVAKETRKAFASVIHRYLAGDRTLITEIQTNAESNAPISKLARATLPEPEDQETRRKRIKREDLELIKLEREVQEKSITNMQSFMGLMNTIRPDWMQTDARFRLQTEDTIKNILQVVGSVHPPLQANLITNDQHHPSPAPKAPAVSSLSISQLVQELGGKRLTHSEVCRVGARAVKKYRALHQQDPPKHRQWVDGAERFINSYTEDDRDMLTEVLTDLGLHGPVGE